MDGQSSDGERDIDAKRRATLLREAEAKACLSRMACEDANASNQLSPRVDIHPCSGSSR